MLCVYFLTFNLHLIVCDFLVMMMRISFFSFNKWYASISTDNSTLCMCACSKRRTFPFRDPLRRVFSIQSERDVAHTYECFTDYVSTMPLYSHGWRGSLLFLNFSFLSRSSSVSYWFTFLYH